MEEQSLNEYISENKKELLRDFSRETGKSNCLYDDCDLSDLYPTEFKEFCMDCYKDYLDELNTSVTNRI